jgi:hypothetical protein
LPDGAGTRFERRRGTDRRTDTDGVTVDGLMSGELVDDAVIAVDVAELPDMGVCSLGERVPSDHGGVSGTGGEVRSRCQARVRH